MKGLITVIISIFIITGLGIWMISTKDNTQIRQKVAFYPEPTNYVVDAAGALSQATIDSLNAELKTFDGKAQIAVAVVKTTAPFTIEEYGIKLAEKWKVGYQGKDNGIIIILATEDRKVRIEVGKGLEGDIPDAVAGRIIDEAMIPSLKISNWDAAIVYGVQALKIKLTK